MTCGDENLKVAIRVGRRRVCMRNGAMKRPRRAQMEYKAVQGMGMSREGNHVPLCVMSVRHLVSAARLGMLTTTRFIDEKKNVSEHVKDDGLFVNDFNWEL